MLEEQKIGENDRKKCFYLKYFLALFIFPFYDELPQASLTSNIVMCKCSIAGFLGNFRLGKLQNLMYYLFWWLQIRWRSTNVTQDGKATQIVFSNFPFGGYELGRDAQRLLQTQNQSSPATQVAITDFSFGVYIFMFFIYFGGYDQCQT